MKRNRFHIVKLNQTTSGPGGPDNWGIVDRDTNRMVDTADTQYAAKQTAKLYNDGIYKVEGDR